MVKRHFKRGDSVRLINAGRYEGTSKEVPEGTIGFVEELEDEDHYLFIHFDNGVKRYALVSELELVAETKCEATFQSGDEETDIFYNNELIMTIPHTYMLNEREVYMGCEVRDWAEQIVKDLNENIPF